jgi:EAL domain-containing protein (putative c-di-GMP-specific phosphodiesterase class I)
MNELSQPRAGSTLPYLEHYPVPGEAPHRILLDQVPFRIGRSMTAHYVIYSRQVSKEHTEIVREGKDFRIRDLGSTNGTFVNGQRIAESALSNGDIIHVAHKELRFGFESADVADDTGGCFTEPAMSQLPASVIRSSNYLREMLSSQSVRVVFQPIVRLDTLAVHGFEALGRGTHSELSTSPSDLFGLADRCRLASELSQLFRTVAVEEASRLPEGVSIFFNLHSSEMAGDALIVSLREFKRSLRETQQVVLEVHEGVVADVDTMRWLREKLNDLEIGLAYDDFGAGQARLTELAEVPPDFIKLDRSLVRDIDRSVARQDMIRALNRLCEDLEVESIAEGIETAAEAAVCRGLGCRFGQGFLFGRPEPLTQATLSEGQLAASGVS